MNKVDLCGYALLDSFIQEMMAGAIVEYGDSHIVPHKHAILEEEAFEWLFHRRGLAIKLGASNHEAHTFTCAICGDMQYDREIDGIRCDPAKHAAYYDAFPRGKEAA